MALMALMEFLIKLVHTRIYAFLLPVFGCWNLKENSQVNILLDHQKGNVIFK